MALKYPNKIKRPGYWKYYEQARIKDYRKVWDTAISFISEEDIPFRFFTRGRKPNLTRKELVCMAILYVYFDLDFREVEHLLSLLTNKHLDHSNCVRWFGKLTQKYVNDLVFKVHKKILGIDNTGDYIADSTTVTCDRYKKVIKAGEGLLKLQTWKLHTMVIYLTMLGLVSIASIFASRGEANDSPFLRKKHLRKSKIIKGRILHADKGYFGKENIEKCRELGLKPNIVPKDKDYLSDNYLKKYAEEEYDNERRKKNRGLVEVPYGGMETETYMKIRCRKPHHRNICVCLMGVKHQLRTYMRASLMKLFGYFAPTSYRTKKE